MDVVSGKREEDEERSDYRGTPALRNGGTPTGGSGALSSSLAAAHR
jgi:hypothetical protein